MTIEERENIANISAKFASGFMPDIPLNGSGWLIVDPLSAYLNALGYENTIKELPQTDERPQVLVMEFGDGSHFIPAGADLKSVHPDSKNWMWILQTEA